MPCKCHTKVTIKSARGTDLLTAQQPASVTQGAKVWAKANREGYDGNKQS